MSTLEVLMNAERSLMDPTEPYDFGEWGSCTCGHIYHGVTGTYGDIQAVVFGDAGGYNEVMVEVCELLGIESYKGMSNYPRAAAISNYTSNLGTKRTTRKHSLKVIREAISKIREMDQAVIVKTLDAHNYEAV